ncbi:MAG: zinc-binding dehydrogenase [Candidatus Bathyarchaeota archaeon]|nr:zinc-binding dehydrogenase [Candidatus Bathyarchaeota archaeon]
MKGVTFIGEKQLRIGKYPDPDPGPGQAVVQMKAATICGSDMHIYRQSKDQVKLRPYVIAGHEPCGIVESVGDCVDNVKPGDRVSVLHAIGCGNCVECIKGYDYRCNQMDTPDGRPWWTGQTGNMHGSFADKLLVPARGCLSLPNSLSYIDGAIMACAGGTAYEVLRKMQVSSLSTVAIYGLGPVGLSALLIAKGLGATVIGIELIDERLELGHKLGLDHAIDVKTAEVVPEVNSLTQSKGADVAIDFSGSNSARLNAINCVRFNGKVAFIGHGDEKLAITPSDLIRRDVTIRGSPIFKTDTYFEMAEFLVKNGISLEKTVTHTFSLDQAKKAFQLFDSGQTGKIAFIWD